MVSVRPSGGLTRLTYVKGQATVVKEDQVVIREKAVRLAVRTGIAPDLDFVWDAQQHGEGQVCFGSYRTSCPRNCHWLERCQLLSSEPVDSRWPVWTDAQWLRDSLMPPPSSDDRWVPGYLRDTAESARRYPPSPV
jgi:hypothetical protein